MRVETRSRHYLPLLWERVGERDLLPESIKHFSFTPGFSPATNVPISEEPFQTVPPIRKRQTVKNRSATLSVAHVTGLPAWGPRPAPSATLELEWFLHDIPGCLQ